jgi:hypothetical protein
MSNESGTEIAFGCVTATVAMLVGTVLRGIVLATLWGWFVVTTLHAPELRPVQALGLSLIVTAFLPTASTKTDSSMPFGKAIVTLVVFSLGSPLLTLGFGWVVRQFL